MRDQQISRLTARERDCLRLIGNGLTAQHAAAELGIKPSTVEKHLSSVRRKLGVDRTVHAVTLVRENGLGKSQEMPVAVTEAMSVLCSDKALRQAQRILSSQSRDEAWQNLQDYLQDEGYVHSLIGLVAEPFGQMTNGARILENTFGREVMDMYDLAGGSSVDPVAMRISQSISPFFTDSNEVVLEHMKQLPEGVTELMRRFLDIDLQQLLVIPATDVSTGAPFCLTLHINSSAQKEFQSGRKPDLQDLCMLLSTYWSFIKGRKHLSKVCALTQRQAEALRLSARGFTVDEAAEHMGVTRRSAEKVLQKTRKRLGVRTTSAAVFRAAVYGAF